MEGAVELAVAAAAEPVPDRLAAGGGDRCDAGEPCEGGFGADAAVVRPADDQLGGDDRADAGLVEQPGCERPDVGEDLASRAPRLRAVAAWMRRARVRSTSVVASSSGVRELERRKRLQRSSSRRTGSRRSSLAELVGCGHDHAAQLHERFAANIDGAAAGEQQQPQRLLSLPRARQRQRLARERRRGPPGPRRAGRPCRCSRRSLRGPRPASSTVSPRPLR